MDARLILRAYFLVRGASPGYRGMRGPHEIFYCKLEVFEGLGCGSWKGWDREASSVRDTCYFAVGSENGNLITMQVEVAREIRRLCPSLILLYMCLSSRVYRFHLVVWESCVLLHSDVASRLKEDVPTSGNHSTISFRRRPKT